MLLPHGPQRRLDLGGVGGVAREIDRVAAALADERHRFVDQNVGVGMGLGQNQSQRE